MWLILLITLTMIGFVTIFIRKKEKRCPDWEAIAANLLRDYHINCPKIVESSTTYVTGLHIKGKTVQSVIHLCVRRGNRVFDFNTIMEALIHKLARIIHPLGNDDILNIVVNELSERASLTTKFDMFKSPSRDYPTSK